MGRLNVGLEAKEGGSITTQFDQRTTRKTQFGCNSTLVPTTSERQIGSIGSGEIWLWWLILSTTVDSNCLLSDFQTTKKQDRIVTLNVQHRMHPQIAEFNSSVVYGDQYFSGSRMVDRGLQHGFLEHL